ncbi:MAG: hypothetical protein ACJAU1_001737, partial [Psychromonas sp.]
MIYNQTTTAENAGTQESYEFKKTYNSWRVSGEERDVPTWLKDNALQAPRAMSSRAKLAAQNLMRKVYKGELAPEYPILRVATIKIKPGEGKLVSGPTRWTGYHPLNRLQYTDLATDNHLRD